MKTVSKSPEGMENKALTAIPRGGWKLRVICLFAVALVVFTAVIRYRSGEIDYKDSDATWHTLLTIECYNETPISQHLFLPIVSMGGQDNKWIKWGATIPDTEGNYYYTSFSPAGYFLPWLFMKILGLPVSEKSLYLFNNVLFSVSAILIVLLIDSVYEDNKNKEVMMLIGSISYVCVPELLHGMGVVYWHQSIMQVTLLAQIYFFYLYAVKSKNGFKWLFYILTLCNPYIEWTGFVANAGFAIAEIVLNWKKSKIAGMKKAIIIGFATIASFGFFCGHYLLRTDAVKFFTALRNRFMARNITTNVLITDVLGGYYKSFLYLWLLLLCFTIWAFVKRDNVRIDNGVVLMVSAFPTIENIIMKQHALAYTYDRMKAVFVMILLLCEITKNLLELYETSSFARFIIIGLTIGTAGLNLAAYKSDTSYIWEVDYRNNNSMLAGFVTSEYPNALYASDSSIRGYMNLLFGRGIYESQSIDSATKLAIQKEKENVVFIRRKGYRLQPIRVTNVATGEAKEVDLDDGNVVERIAGDYWYAADLTDQNWTKGVSNSKNIILFERNDSLLVQLLTGKMIKTDEDEYDIVNVDFDDLWIRVEISGNKDSFSYPAPIIIE